MRRGFNLDIKPAVMGSPTVGVRDVKAKGCVVELVTRSLLSNRPSLPTLSRDNSHHITPPPFAPPQRSQSLAVPARRSARAIHPPRSSH